MFGVARLTLSVQILSQKELVALAPDVTTRTEALNFLLGTVCILECARCFYRTLSCVLTGDAQSIDSLEWPCIGVSRCDEEGNGRVRFFAVPSSFATGFVLILFRKKDMSGEEIMVLGHIQAAANKGVYPLCWYMYTTEHQC